MSRKRAHSPPEARVHSPPAAPIQEEEPKIFKSNPIEDRKSTFTALYSPSESAKSLQAHPDFKTAMHRMAGWRKPSGQRTLSGKTSTATTTIDKQLMITGSDDDGEKYGGKRIEKVLNELNVEGSVVVARWYGGILLGPVRFTHIEDAAREAISLWKDSRDDGGRGKRRKISDSSTLDEVAEKTRLALQLVERDESITALRKLLADKSTPSTSTANDGDNKASGDVSPQKSSNPVSPVKKPDYSEMPLQRLRQIDKARDATIAWILKQIDAAEAKPEVLSGSVMNNNKPNNDTHGSSKR